MPFPPGAINKYAATAAAKKPLSFPPGKKPAAPGAPVPPPHAVTPGTAAPDPAAAQDKALAAHIGQQVEAGVHDPEVKAKMQTHDPSQCAGDTCPPPAGMDPAAWDRAHKAVDPAGEGAHYSDPHLVVGHVAQAIGQQAAAPPAGAPPAPPAPPGVPPHPAA